MLERLVKPSMKQYYKGDCGCIYQQKGGKYTLVYSCIALYDCTQLTFNKDWFKGKKLTPLSKFDMAILKMENSK